MATLRDRQTGVYTIEDNALWSDHRTEFGDAIRAKYPIKVTMTHIRDLPMKEGEDAYTYMARYRKRVKEVLGTDPEEVGVADYNRTMWREGAVTNLPKEVRKELEKVVDHSDMEYEQWFSNIRHHLDLHLKNKAVCVKVYSLAFSSEANIDNHGGLLTLF